MRGVRPEVLDSAREAARRSGMSVEEWLDTVIAESARNAGIDPAAHRLSDFDDRGAYNESPDTRSWRRESPLVAGRALRTSARASTRSPAKSIT